ncbi:hypothetical protein BH24GEM3_BH24GEM3_12780 [soil metagenome]
MFPRFRVRSGVLRAPLASAALALVLLLGGCGVYSFTGGGLPRHIRTVAVLPFDNVTTQGLLSTDLQLALQEALPRNLGVRLADQSVADAVVRGRITGYNETTPNIRPATPGGAPAVIQQEIRITFEAEIYDLRENRPIWEARSLSGIGTFAPERGEQFTTGKARAIEDLVRKLIEGAQSQW